MKIFILLLFFSCQQLHAQINDLQANKGSDTSKPLLLYITGDGGWNSFSSDLFNKLHAEGYSVLGLNAKTYFWKKKTPDALAADVSQILKKYGALWQLKKFVLIGYSFGADVLPFAVTRLPAAIRDSVKHVVLLSPAAHTDFEIHVLGFTGWYDSNGESIPAELNKIALPLHLFFGTDEDDFPMDKLQAKNARVIYLKGGHHYDGNVAEVEKKIVMEIK